MNWQDIEISLDRKSFTHNSKRLFQKKFLTVLEFQPPGIASVQVDDGWYHINSDGNPIYNERFDRVFGFYFNRAAVIKNRFSYHIDIYGLPAYEERYKWCGNFQEKLCTVKDFENHYFHIDLDGKILYEEKYCYAGDFKEGIACICLENGKYTHIDSNGKKTHEKEFELLDVYHKGYARAKDKDGWFHIDRKGKSIGKFRYSLLEPFYNGFALAVTLSGKQIILSESGEETILDTMRR